MLRLRQLILLLPLALASTDFLWFDVGTSAQIAVSFFLLARTLTATYITVCLPYSLLPLSPSVCLSVSFSHLMWATAKRMKRCAVCQQQISVLAMPRFISLAFSLHSYRSPPPLFPSALPLPLSAVHFSSFLMPLTKNPLRLSSLHSGHYNSIMAVKQFYFGLFCCGPSLPLSFSLTPSPCLPLPLSFLSFLSPAVARLV